MKHGPMMAKIPEYDHDIRARAYWVSLSSRQISVLAQVVGTYNRDRKPWNDIFLLLVAYFLITFERFKIKTVLRSHLMLCSMFLFLGSFSLLFLFKTAEKESRQ